MGCDKKKKRKKKEAGQDGPVSLTLLSDKFRVKVIGLAVQKKFNIDFHDGGHLGFLIKMILPTFDLQVTSILPMKFRVNWPFCPEEKVLNRFSTGLLGRLSWISNQNDFSYF